MQMTLLGGPSLPCAVPVCDRGPGVRASSPQAAKMAALPGNGRSGPRWGPPDRPREAHDTIGITRQERVADEWRETHQP